MADDADLTIDQLAQRTGMTVRNLRAHQSRGLLLPPEDGVSHRLFGQDVTLWGPTHLILIGAPG